MIPDTEKQPRRHSSMVIPVYSECDGIDVLVTSIGVTGSTDGTLEKLKALLGPVAGCGSAPSEGIYDRRRALPPPHQPVVPEILLDPRV